MWQLRAHPETGTTCRSGHLALTPMNSSRSSLRVDRPVLLSNLIAGAALLLVAVVWIGPWVPVIGVAYVVAGSMFLAAVHARREALTYGQEALAWATAWLVAVALWALIGSQIGGVDSGSGWPLNLVFGLVIATPSYLVWQIVALAVRQFMAWRSSGESLRVAHAGD